MVMALLLLPNKQTKSNVLAGIERILALCTPPPHTHNHCDEKWNNLSDCSSFLYMVEIIICIVGSK